MMSKEGQEKRMQEFMNRKPEPERFSVGTIEEFYASEEARRRAMYGGRAASMRCDIRIKRKDFPVLYEIACSISAEDDLHHYQSRETADISYSTPDHILGELKMALSAMLAKKKDEFEKARVCGKKE